MFLDTIALPLGSIGEAATRTLVHGTAAMTTISETLAALAHAYGQLDLPTAAGLWVIILALGLAGPALAARRQRGLHAARSAADEGTSSDRRSPSDFMQQAGLADDEEAPDHIGRYLATGSIMAAVMVVGLGGWASTTELAGAVLGIRGLWQHLQLDVAVGLPLYKPEGFRTRPWSPYLSLTYAF